MIKTYITNVQDLEPKAVIIPPAVLRMQPAQMSTAKVVQENTTDNEVELKPR